MNPHTEHQQDHADLGELRGEFRRSLEAGGERADGDTCKEVANDRRQLQACCDQPSGERERQRDADRGNEFGLVRNRRDLRVCVIADIG